MTDFVVIAGLSGAGRSSAADELEDLGWFVVDNLPAPLFPKFLELTSASQSTFDRVAFVVGAGPHQAEVMSSIHSLEASGATVRVLFLDASTEALVRRYESTKRRHPHGEGIALTEAIAAERALLDPVRDEADLVIDTSDLNIHDLRARIVDLFGAESPDNGMRIRIVSFGYKHGLPLEADLVFDCRFLPNPHWVDELRPLTGRDAAVRDYVLAQDATGPFLDELTRLLELLLPAYHAEGRAYLTIAVGCTGGHHRSVVVAEELGRRLTDAGARPTVNHRDADR